MVLQITEGFKSTFDERTTNRRKKAVYQINVSKTFAFIAFNFLAHTNTLWPLWRAPCIQSKIISTRFHNSSTTGAAAKTATAQKSISIRTLINLFPSPRVTTFCADIFATIKSQHASNVKFTEANRIYGWKKRNEASNSQSICVSSSASATFTYQRILVFRVNAHFTKIYAQLRRIESCATHTLTVQYTHT